MKTYRLILTAAAMLAVAFAAQAQTNKQAIQQAEQNVQQKEQDLAAALSSFLYGRPDDRKLYKLAMKGISNPETRKQYAEEWHDRRTSMSDLGKKAWMLGEKILGETK